MLALSFSAASHGETLWRITPDLVVKNQWLSESEPSPGAWYSLGVDAYRTFNQGNRRLATATVQVYQWCVEDRLRKPGILKGTDDCELVSKVSTVNFHVSGDGRFNILVGHPELPYGLEVPVSTNETARTLLTPRDTGLKLDWGVGVNGSIGGWQYAATLTRGSGFEWDDQAKDGSTPWAFAARVGTDTGGQRFLPNPGIGFSFFKADALNPAGLLTERWRGAIDWIEYFGPWGVMSQLSVGETEDRSVYNLFAELNRSNASEDLSAYLQYKSFNEDFDAGWERAQSVHLGVRWAITPLLTVSAQISREFEVFAGGPEQTIFDIQLRLRRD